jgi:hypothetical protein
VDYSTFDVYPEGKLEDYFPNQAEGLKRIPITQIASTEAAFDNPIIYQHINAHRFVSTKFERTRKCYLKKRL